MQNYIKILKNVPTENGQFNVSGVDCYADDDVFTKAAVFAMCIIESAKLAQDSTFPSTFFTQKEIDVFIDVTQSLWETTTEPQTYEEFFIQSIKSAALTLSGNKGFVPNMIMKSEELKLLKSICALFEVI